MGTNSKIEWTDHTFNPWMGCTKVSPACQHCYAERHMDHRYRTVAWGPSGTRVKTSVENWKKPVKWNERARFDLAYWSERVDLPKPDYLRPRVFCASFADVFEDWSGPIRDHHGKVLMNATVETAADNSRQLTMDDLRSDLFELIDETPHLDWLLLTKRPENVARMWPVYSFDACVSGDCPHWDKHDCRPDRFRDNVWIGTSVESQKYAVYRIPQLLACRELCPVLFLSCEPLLGPVALPRGSEIDWVIAGGESGPNARPCDPDWARSLRDQCELAGVPFFWKQWGEFDEHQRRVGKKAAGRLLDGKTHDGVPVGIL